MKVNGEAFKSARLKIRKNSPKRGVKGEPARGTQEWLAEKSGTSVRAIQYLEDGEASIATVDSVSSLLQLKGRELIIGYGEEYVSCRMNGVVDFRPADYPLDDESGFFKSPVMITVDPISIIFKSVDINRFYLEKMEMMVFFPDSTVNLTWIYNVSMTPNATGWLGVENEVRPFFIETSKGDEEVHNSIMFNSEEIPFLSWEDFIFKTSNLKEPKLAIEVKIIFSNFEKIFPFYISTDYLKALIDEGRKSRNSLYPYRVQIRPIY